MTVLGRLLCVIGIHRWLWSYDMQTGVGGYHVYRCKHCGAHKQRRDSLI